MTPEFECSNCGVCCSQIALIVAGDIREILENYDYPVEDFVHFYDEDDFDEEFAPDDQWLNMEDGKRIIGMARRNDTCFFRRDGRCAIYPHRPLMCAMHPYQPRDAREEPPEFNLQCHHGCKGVPKGPMSPQALKNLQEFFEVFSHREWDYDDLVSKWNRKGRKKRSEQDFFRFLGVLDQSG